MRSKPFVFRRASRDQESDELRCNQIEQAVRLVVSELEKEASGLEARYNAATADAAFLLEAVANGSAYRRPEERGRELTDAVARYEARMKALGRQKTLYREIERLIINFRSSLRPEGESRV